MYHALISSWLVLASLVVPSRAVPITDDHIFQKRTINPECHNLLPAEVVFYHDCNVAITQIRPPHDQTWTRINLWGPADSADVRLTVMTWIYGTCTVKLACEDRIGQYARWTDIRANALKILHQCVSLDKKGEVYIERRAADPTAAFFQPSLHVWILPSNSEEAGVTATSANIRTFNLERCSALHREGERDVPQCSWDTWSAGSATSVVGGSFRRLQGVTGNGNGTVGANVNGTGTGTGTVLEGAPGVRNITVVGGP
ncbi:hypothetical protein MMC21_007056 [Puttea exsequens]|nr:hypothetical protein [Puttea exsequens]